MPMYNLNDPESHDGTTSKTVFGGPYEIYIGLSGETLARGTVGKGDELRISVEPIGETESDDDD